MARAKVEIQEQSIDTRIPSFPGIYGGIVIPALKGVVNEARLVTNDTDLLKYFTPDETIKVGYDSSYYSAIPFLIKSNKLWVVRAANNPLYGGVTLAQNPPFTSLDIYFNNGNNTISLRTTTTLQKTNAELFFNIVHTGEKVGVSSDGTLPTELSNAETYFLFNAIEINGVYTFQLASTEENAENGVPISFSDNGMGNASLTLKGTNANKSLTTGLLDPFTYIMDSSDGRVAGLSSVFEVDVARDSFQVSTEMYALSETGDRVNITATIFPTADTGDPLAAGTDYYIIKVQGHEEVQLARSLADSSNGIFIPISSLGENIVITFIDKSNTSTATAYPATNDFECTSAFYSTCVTGDVIRIASGSSDFPLPDVGDPLTPDTDYYAIKTAVADRVQLARTASDAANGTAITIASAGADLSLTLTTKEHTGASTTDLSNDTISVDPTFMEWIENKDKVQVSSDGTLPGGLTGNTDYYVIKGETTIKLAISPEAVDIEEAIDITSSGSGIHTILNVSNQKLTGLEQSCLFIYGSNPGAWNNNIYITTLHYPYGDSDTWTTEQQDAADKVKEPDCFLIYVYKKNPDKSLTLVEGPHLCSRIPGKKDGYNKNVYVEDVLEGSNYIRAIDNDMVDSSIYPKDQTDILMLYGGDDGGSVTDTHMLQALDVLGNRKSLNVTVLLDGGWTTPAYQKQGLLSVAGVRKDCVSVLTIPFAAEDSSNYINEIIKYRKETLNADSTRGALYSCHLKIRDPYNDRDIYVPSDGYVGAAISETASNFEIWYPPAGSTRGQLDVLDVRRRFSDGELDILYDNQINPIDFYPGRGIRIWGNKTLTSRPESRDRLNVRLLLIVIEPAIAEFLETFLFDINDTLTRSLAESGIRSYMENIKARRGVSSYSVVCSDKNNTPEDIDANRMNVWLYVTPVKSAEDIRFTTIITRTGSEFSVG